MRPDLHEANRLSWNAATAAHNSHKGDQAAFLRGGGSTLFPEERELLGDVKGLRLLHLQCNSGQDTLSLARLGAVVTGVDISDEAVEFARRLSAESGIPGAFERADVYGWLEEAGRAGRRFDVVFASYGAVCWLSELGAWARGIAGVLEPRGRFVLVEFHPVAAMFDERMRLFFPYFSGGEPVTWGEGVADYVARSGEGLLHGGEYREGVVDFRNPHPVHEFAWGIADVVSALLEAGLALEVLREYPYSNGCVFFEGMRALPGRRWAPPEGTPAIPLMYAVAARRGR
ncbi:MAG TPA: methyltransferase domain-containing protein [Longimicrobiaceae bacterium]|nr:methyltransferase domain-containing protein [Longimicrobiaceae bacterium]